jgi:hypothetical protein
MVMMMIMKKKKNKKKKILYFSSFLDTIHVGRFPTLHPASWEIKNRIRTLCQNQRSAEGEIETGYFWEAHFF